MSFWMDVEADRGWRPEPLTLTFPPTAQAWEHTEPGEAEQRAQGARDECGDGLGMHTHPSPLEACRRGKLPASLGL
jgi:hypothetical protein